MNLGPQQWEPVNNQGIPGLYYMNDSQSGQLLYPPGVCVCRFGHFWGHFHCHNQGVPLASRGVLLNNLQCAGWPSQEGMICPQMSVTSHACFENGPTEELFSRETLSCWGQVRSPLSSGMTHWGKRIKTLFLGIQKYTLKQYTFKISPELTWWSSSSDSARPMQSHGFSPWLGN